MEEEYYEDFYDEEYESFDSTIQELKEQLKKDVKQEIKDRIVGLEKENEQLKQVKENWEKIKRTYEDKVKEVEREKDYILGNAKQEIYNATLKDMLENCSYFTKLYKVDYETEQREKCNKCDERRKLTLTDCFGRKHEVYCKCNTNKYIYYAKENSSTCIYIQKGQHENNFKFEFRNTETYDYAHKIDKENVLEKFDKDKVKGYWNTYFTTLEEAQKYADYLNSIED